jgi:DNA primase large subunit
MELTQQYFDEQIKKLASKEDLGEQTKELKAFAREQTEELARIISKSIVEPMEKEFAALEKKLDVKPRVEKLEKDMVAIKTALHLS